MATANYIRLSKPVQIIGKKARVECDQCGGHEDWNLDARPPPEILKKHFTTKGWDFGRRTRCPSCTAKKEKKAMATVTQIKAEPAPSLDARAARREAHDLIAITFDIAAGQYRDEYSDQRIAKETGVSLDWVKQRREEEFGPLKEPQEFRELRDQIAAMNERIASLVNEATALDGKLKGMAKSAGWAI